MYLLGVRDNNIGVRTFYEGYGLYHLVSANTIFIMEGDDYYDKNDNQRNNNINATIKVNWDNWIRSL